MIIGDHLVEKTCIKCGFVGDETLFLKNENRCKECKKEYMKNYRKSHPDKIKESRRKWRENNPDKIKEYKKLWKKNNPEKIRVYNTSYLQTSNGKASNNRRSSKRRKLGHKPINKWFKDSDAHHLRYSKNPHEQNNDITIYVPRKLHRSIPHNGNTGQGMREINIACLEWYLNNTPEEERHPKAVKLYWNYCILPAPDWINGDEENGFI